MKLRRGGRVLGGSLSWEQPQALAAFTRESPFFDLTVPNDVTVTRQVLAEPDADARPSAPGRRWPTARRSSPRSAAARA